MTSAQRPRRVPGQTIPCGWCGKPIALRATGRIPTWCSDTCRHRAWEQRRALASPRAPVEVVDRVIEVETPIQVIKEVAVPTTPKRGDWPALLRDLAGQIDAGRVYDRDLPDVSEGLEAIVVAIGRRRHWARRSR